MNVPVATLLQNIEEFGTSSDGWEKVADNVGVPEEMCQEILADLKKEADRKDRLLKKSVMGTGGGPPPGDDGHDPLLEKVKVLIGPALDGLYTIYDGDSSLMATQPDATPIEAKNVERGSPLSGKSPLIIKDDDIIEDEMYFTNNRANLKRKPHQLLTRKRKLEMEPKQTVCEKFKSLASDKMELVQLQKEVLKIQLQEEKDRAEHNSILRNMELEDAKKKYEHNDTIRKLELERLILNK